MEIIGGPGKGAGGGPGTGDGPGPGGTGLGPGPGGIGLGPGPAKRQPRKATPPTKATTAEARPEAQSAKPAQPKAAPAKAAQPEVTPAQGEVAPVKKAARPAKKAAATIKAAAAEIAPAVVTPDMTTVPDEPPTATPPPNPTPSAQSLPAKTLPNETSPAKTSPSETSPSETSPSRQPAADNGSANDNGSAAEDGSAAKGNAPSADDELMPDDTPNLAADVHEKARSGATSPAAEPPATAPGQPGAAVPVASTLPPAVAAMADTLSGVRTEAWPALIADPGHAPELLALAALQTIGPRAGEWAARTRAAYPAAGPDALARLAVSQFTRFGSVSSVFAAVAGSYAPIALLGAAAYTHAELALHVAAAYGLDPTDRERAVDLLVLTRVHPVREDAVAALATAEQHSYDNSGLTDVTWRLGRMIAVQAGGWAAVRAINHFFPGTSLLVATLTSRGAARAMAARATVHYRALSRGSVTAS
ncbi:hypothetical protein AB0C29_04595 [Actinoplanes sp. NPDC048791]|uniref:hypothetical protein n=1 Tax=Actinoplanes sp. NPDC048791 TaxID=3154623 RepID=UPI0033C6D049